MRIRTAVVPALAALLALNLAACGGTDANDAKAASSDGLTKVTLDTLAIANVAFLVEAKEQGIFEKHGIDLEIKYVEPPALVPDLMSGNADVIWNNPPALLAARSNNVPLKSVTTVSTAGTTQPPSPSRSWSRKTVPSPPSATSRARPSRPPRSSNFPISR